MNSVVFTKEVIEFVTVAKEYCIVMDSLNTMEREEFVLKIHKINSLLYLKASLLTPPQTIYEIEIDRYVTEEMYGNTLVSLQRLLDNYDLSILADPYTTDVEKENEWVYISEILADTYQSLCDFLSVYRTGNEEMMNDALFELISDFKELWGHKLLALQFVFHKTLYTDEYLELIERNTFDDSQPNTDKWFTEKRRKDWYGYDDE